MKLLVLLLILYSCSHNNKTETIYVSGIKVEAEFEKELVKADLLKLLEISEHVLISFPYEHASIQLLPLLRNYLREVVISSKNCSRGDMACTFPSYPTTIFLTAEYLKMNQFQRLATLVHESFHLYESDVLHVACISKKITNTQCDNGFYSAFGTEYLFISSLLQKKLFTESEKIHLKRALSLAQPRINILN